MERAEAEALELLQQPSSDKLSNHRPIDPNAGVVEGRQISEPTPTTRVRFDTSSTTDETKGDALRFTKRIVDVEPTANITRLPTEDGRFSVHHPNSFIGLTSFESTSMESNLAHIPGGNHEEVLSYEGGQDDIVRATAGKDPEHQRQTSLGYHPLVREDDRQQQHMATDNERNGNNYI